QDAQANGYAVPAFNIHNAETIQAILLCLPRMNDYALHHAVNGATELKIAFAGAVKAWFAENPQGNDP
ncbi:class II fructose-bisphosphate aldolase, partial [Escherichia sp. TWPC-MK]